MYLMFSVGDKAKGCSKMKKTSTFLWKPESNPAKKPEKEKSLIVPYRYSQ